MIEIREVNNKNQIKEFINIPWNIYKDDPNWVPPLKMSIADQLNPTHPFYKTAKTKSFLAYENGKPAGRIMSIINHNSPDIGYFGFYEAINQQVSDQLFEKVKEHLKENGINKMQGPVNLSTNYECGLLVDGFNDPPQIMMTYNPKNYINFFEHEGLTKAKDLYAWKFNLEKGLPEIIQRIADRASNNPRFKVRKINKSKWNDEVKLMHQIYNEAWEDNWGFIPMTDEEFFHTAKDLKMIVEEELVKFVEVDGEVAGFIVALPDLNQIFKKIPSGNLFPTGIFKLLFSKKSISRMRVITMGLRPKFRNLGLDALMYHEGFHSGKKLGMNEVEMSWILADNVKMNKPIQRLGSELYKTYRIYHKDL